MGDYNGHGGRTLFNGLISIEPSILPLIERHRFYIVYPSQCRKFEGNLAEASASRSCGGGPGSLLLPCTRPQCNLRPCHLYQKGTSSILPIRLYLKTGIPPGKSDASGSIGPTHIVTSTSSFSGKCRPMRPIFPVEFQLKESHGFCPVNPSTNRKEPFIYC